MGDISSIHELNLESKLIKEKDLIAFLNKRYENIEHTYGISIRLREDEIKSISWIIEKQKNWDLLKKLGELGMKLYPESVYGYYMIALSDEKNQCDATALDYSKKDLQN